MAVVKKAIWLKTVLLLKIKEEARITKKEVKEAEIDYISNQNKLIKKSINLKNI